MKNMVTPEGEQRKRQVAGVFDRAASSYDEVAGSYFSLFGPRLVDRADIQRGATVIDVACGKGATLFPAIEMLGPEGMGIGVDLSEEMVRQTEARARRDGLENVRVAVMDGEAPALRDERADVVICAFSLHFFSDPLAAIGCLARILVQGGRLAISEWGPTDEDWAWEDDLIGALPVRGVSTGSFEAPGALEHLLADASMEDVEAVTESVTISLADEEEWWRWKWSYSFRHVLEQLDPAKLERFKANAFAHLERMRGDTGIPLTLHALMAVARKP